MFRIVAEGVQALDWANAISVLGLCAALFALIQSSRSNRAAKEANSISREANELAAKALKMQEDEGQVRLVVKPGMRSLVGQGEDPRPRPVVTVINLSAFPVTIDRILWKTGRTEKAWLYWENPTICEPFGKLPARLPPHEALTAVGTPTTFQSLDDLQAITAAVAVTSCEEQIEGMSQEWREDVARIVSESTERRAPLL
ncbi:MAG TPA: hypothetical protein PKK06_07930 [Phycisphaerae bacterium]|nr:hypothetical protein [Phycisphaerae bacterium]HNU46034.1 hypothetical protein [Phycisphaerae bacterium]